jgi:tetratricopeptide (TPR) repeat protein
MTIDRGLHVALFALALMLALATAAGAAELDDALASLRTAVAKHPNDPDVSWALADALEAAGRSAEAALHMQRHLARWPDRPAHGWRALGRAAYGAGRINDAIAALRRALERDEGDAEAHLYLGLALQQKGQSRLAETHFEAAAEHDDELAPEALLLSGMSRVARGDDQIAAVRLHRVIDLAPHSDSALDARALLDDARLFRPPVTVESFAGVAYDSNATLGSAADVPGASSAEDDALFEFGTDVTWRPPLGNERNPVELSVRYARYDYASQTDLSEQVFNGGISSLLHVGPRLGLYFEGEGATVLVDNDLYGVNGWVRQSLLVPFSKQQMLRIYGNGGRQEYEDAAFTDSLERDGWLYGGGAEHVMRLGHESEIWFSWGGRYTRRDTDAKRDELGFGGAYDAHLAQGSLRVASLLPFEIRGRAELFFDAHFYDHRNLIDALSEGVESPTRRRDLVWTSGLSLRRAIYRGVDLEVHAEFADIDSNVDLYSYQRAQTGMRLRAELP